MYFLGAFTGLIVAKLKIAPFIVTLGMLSFCKWSFLLVYSIIAYLLAYPGGAYVINFIGSSKIFGIPVLAVIWVVMILITAFIMRRTIIGRIM